MNFIAKQVLKSKTGGLSEKFEDLSKKCKDVLNENSSTTNTESTIPLSEEEELAQKEEMRRQHYAAFNANREEQRDNMRNKYGLKKPEEVSSKENNCSNKQEADDTGVSQRCDKQDTDKKNNDCSVM